MELTDITPVEPVTWLPATLRSLDLELDACSNIEVGLSAHSPPGHDLQNSAPISIWLHILSLAEPIVVVPASRLRLTAHGETAALLSEYLIFCASSERPEGWYLANTEVKVGGIRSNATARDLVAAFLRSDGSMLLSAPLDVAPPPQVSPEKMYSSAESSLMTLCSAEVLFEESVDSIALPAVGSAQATSPRLEGTTPAKVYYCLSHNCWEKTWTVLRREDLQGPVLHELELRMPALGRVPDVLHSCEQKKGRSRSLAFIEALHRYLLSIDHSQCNLACIDYGEVGLVHSHMMHTSTGLVRLSARDVVTNVKSTQCPDYYEGEGRLGSGRFMRRIIMELAEVQKEANAGGMWAQHELSRRYDSGYDGLESDPKKGFGWSKKAAEQGLPAALRNMSVNYENGDGCEKNEPLALEYLKQAVAKGNAVAIHHLSELYLTGEGGVKEDKKEGMRLLKQAAELGHGEALAVLAHHHFAHNRMSQGIRCFQRAFDAGNFEIASIVAIYYREGPLPTLAAAIDLKAAEAGAAASQCAYGMCCEYGNGIPKDPEAAVRWYTKAAEQDDGNGMLALSKCYLRGYGGLVQSEEKALAYLVQAANVGSVEAMTRLAEVLEQKGDFEKAIQWYTKAADFEDEKGAFQLALRLLQHYPKNSDGFTLLLALAERGFSTAYAVVAQCYRFGVAGAEHSWKKHHEWLRRGIAEGEDHAMFELGNRYESGEGVTRSARKAFKWFMRAAAAGNAASQSAVGLCYYRGLGVTRNRSEAIRWITLAADQGEAEAQFNLGEFHRTGNGCDQDAKYAVLLFKKAAEQGHLNAMRQLAIAYENGVGTESNIAVAKQWQEIVEDIEKQT